MNNETAWRNALASVDEASTNADYEKVKKETQANPYLTYRQKDGIFARCDYQMGLLAGSEKKREKYEPSTYDKERMNKKGLNK